MIVHRRPITLPPATYWREPCPTCHHPLTDHGDRIFGDVCAAVQYPKSCRCPHVEDT